MSDYCTLSIYVPQRYYLPLLDVVAKELGCRSRSVCLTRLLEQLFLAHGLLDKQGRVTDKARAASKELVTLLRASKLRQQAQRQRQRRPSPTPPLPEPPRRRKHHRH